MKQPSAMKHTLKGACTLICTLRFMRNAVHFFMFALVNASCERSECFIKNIEFILIHLATNLNLW
ncbi:MAG: hypothetical protein IJ962_00580 [Clostridia bacterium]|nr:hypothetical protein [Clostridia bacterium]